MPLAAAETLKIETYRRGLTQFEQATSVAQTKSPAARLRGFRGRPPPCSLRAAPRRLRPDLLRLVRAHVLGRIVRRLVRVAIGRAVRIDADRANPQAYAALHHRSAIAVVVRAVVLERLRVGDARAGQQSRRSRCCENKPS